MFALAPLMRVALDMRDLGLVLGGPLGALLAVLIVQRLARIRLLARILPWFFVRRKPCAGPSAASTRRPCGCASSSGWTGRCRCWRCCASTGPGAAEAGTDRDKALRKIGKLIYALHRTGPESLPVVAHELIQEAKNSGFEGLEGLPAFLDDTPAEKQVLTWKPDLQSKYEAFGHIVEGDQVVVERRP